MSSQLCLLRRMSGTCLLACMMLSLISRYYRTPLQELQGFDAFVLCIYALCIYEKEMSHSVKLDLVPFFSCNCDQNSSRNGMRLLGSLSLVDSAAGSIRIKGTNGF